MGDGERGSESSSFSAISSTNGSEKEGGGDREAERERERNLRGLRGTSVRVLKVERGGERRRRWWWWGGRKEVEG